MALPGDRRTLHISQQERHRPGRQRKRQRHHVNRPLVRPTPPRTPQPSVSISVSLTIRSVHDISRPHHRPDGRRSPASSHPAQTVRPLKATPTVCPQPDADGASPNVRTEHLRRTPRRVRTAQISQRPPDMSSAIYEHHDLPNHGHEAASPPPITRHRKRVRSRTPMRSCMHCGSGIPSTGEETQVAMAAVARSDGRRSRPIQPRFSSRLTRGTHTRERALRRSSAAR